MTAFTRSTDHPGQTPVMLPMALSVKQELRGCILLTGGLGFLGSVCLEQLLARTEVKKVFLLVRPKRNLSGRERVQKLLCGPLFHRLHQKALAGCYTDTANPFSKVCVVEGDIEHPGLGLSAADTQQLLAEVDVVIHSAANLTLDAHIQKALRSNFNATRQLLDLASQMPQLRCFVYVSTYYVNNFKPYNTPVQEEVHYPTFQFAGDSRTLSYNELVSSLLTMAPATAADEVSAIMQRINFTSTYAFSKLLTEQLVDDCQTLPGVAKVIVRPSLISSIAGGPYPGYIAGYAGAPGYSLGYGLGLFHDIGSVAVASDGILDLIPVDVTAALVITAAAAAAAHGPYEGDAARVYHAASAESNPLLGPQSFKQLHEFWSANPPPFRLPFSRYPTYTGRHRPTALGLRYGYLMTAAKVWAAAKLLQLMGKSRQARAVEQGFKAFTVQNTPEYARSIVSKVDNARELQLSIVPEERSDWTCVFEGREWTWHRYGGTALAGLRTIALRQPVSDITGVEHSFVPKQGLTDPSLMTHWMMAAGTDSERAARNTSAASPASTASANIRRTHNESSSSDGSVECHVVLGNGGSSDKAVDISARAGRTALDAQVHTHHQQCCH